MNIARGGYTSSPYHTNNLAKLMPAHRSRKIKAYLPAAGKNCPDRGQTYPGTHRQDA
ncbi:hypothetical protein AFERRI_120010 [Acidithiobacillus ferrivorans]|uniref:Uncharacterized protein n=1 Tax=Acidithiobacillus ferrivorans TaxID=160808 RepID=A0A060UJP7_9PROT|nr:hypothetical protein AFERRI_120010 [Acidithiobacillus ferrivorans]